MLNPYEAPKTDLDTTPENTSGTGKLATIPEGVKGWCWGAFFLGWIWAIGNKTWIGLWAIVPYLGFFMQITLGIKGREWAWRNKRWESVEHFQKVQRRWSIFGLILFIISMAGMIAAVALPAYQEYLLRAQG